jgi:hypothetical protein
MFPVNTDTMGAEGSRLRPLAAILGVLAVAALAYWWPGCRQYAPVTSPESLGALRLLNTACNTRNPALLAEVETRVSRLASQAKMSPREKEGFLSIIGMARRGEWKNAEVEALRMASDQIGMGHPSP